MPATSLNHYTIRVRDLERTKDFYEDIVGLKSGDRPPVAVPGYWLYCGNVPVVHLIGRFPEEPEFSGSEETGRLDHIAFEADDLEFMKDRLRSNEIAFEERVLPRMDLTQLFFRDPDGINIEFNFPSGETVRETT